MHLDMCRCPPPDRVNMKQLRAHLKCHARLDIAFSKGPDDG